MSVKIVDETLSSAGDSLDVKALIKDWNTQTSSVDSALVSLSQIINEL